jgi:tetratricopeptide (TPR) repeat protein
VLAAPLRAEEKLDARGYYERGNSMFALERYGDAAANYEKAFELKSDAALLYNAAQAHRLAGNKQRALALYQSLLRMFGKQVANQAEIRNHIDSLKQAIENDKTVSTRPPVTTQPAEVPKTPESAPKPEPTPAATPSVSPAPAAATTVTTSAPERKPIVKKAWFWVAVVGGAAVVATGIGLGVALGSSKSDPAVTFGTVQVTGPLREAQGGSR